MPVGCFYVQNCILTDRFYKTNELKKMTNYLLVGHLF